MNKKRSRYMTELYKSEKKVRIEEDILLPDYNSDVVRVVRLDVLPTLTSKKVSVREDCALIDLSGKVKICIVYRGENDFFESYSSSADFFDTVKVPLDKSVDPEELFATVSLRPEGFSTKVVSPRRMSVRGDAIVDIRLCSNTELLPFEKSENTETREREYTSSSILFSLDTEERISKEIKLPKSLSPIERVLSATLYLDTESASAGQGRVNYFLTGHLVVLYLPEREEGECERIESFYQPLEIKGSFEIDPAFSDATPILTLDCGEVNFEIIPDSFGDSRILKVDIGYFLQALLLENEGITLTTDAYVSGKSTRERQESREIRRYLGRHRQSTRIKEKLRAKKEMTVLEGVVGCGRVKRVYFEGDSLFADAEISVTGISGERGEESGFSEALLVTLPIDTPLDLKEKGRELSFYPSLSVGFVEHSTEHGELEVSFDATLTLEVFGSENVKYISALEVEDMPQREGKVLFYYPTGEDTLWDIGKKYSVSQRSLFDKNPEIKEDELPRVLRIV